MIIIITSKDFSVRIYSDAMVKIKIEKVQLDFTNLEYIDIDAKKFIWVLEEANIIHKF